MSAPVEFVEGDRVRGLVWTRVGTVTHRASSDAVTVQWDDAPNDPLVEKVQCLELIGHVAPPAAEADAPDMVNHPPHYTSHPAGVECIDVVEHMPYNVGAAMKYLWREGLKGDGAAQVEDLRKAAWYATREADRLERARADAFLAPSAKGAEGWQQ